MQMLLDAVQVASLLQISKRKLESLLAAGDGPPYVQFGRVRRWRQEDVDAWVVSRVESRPQKASQ